jgi:hypothetical protein
LSTIGVDIGDHNVVARFGETFYQSAPNAISATCHDHHSTFI